MDKIIEFSKERRAKYQFVTRDVRVQDEDGHDTSTYPCIVLIDMEFNIPVAYTGYEKFIKSLASSELHEGTTRRRKAFEVCRFLNYILHNTKVNMLAEVTFSDIRGFLIASKMKTETEEYTEDTWYKALLTVFEFLSNYYDAYCNMYDFKYKGDELMDVTIVKDTEHHRRIKLVKNAYFNVKPPKTTHKKNRVLMYGYLELLLYEAMKYDPMLTLGIALQAYAGLREGEVVNLTVGKISMTHGLFSTLTAITIDLYTDAPFWVGYTKKTDPGSIKKRREQRVYDNESFLKRIKDLYEEQLLRLEVMNCSTDKDAPLFVNKQGNPMTVQTYSGRIKRLFYDHFLPNLKETCEQQGTWPENAPYIEIYEKEYPGAHMFRHWFTMYLLTKAHLEVAEIQKWRGDSSPESMAEYIHENSDLIDTYEKSSYRFQQQILEDIEIKYGRR